MSPHDENVYHASISQHAHHLPTFVFHCVTISQTQLTFVACIQDHCGKSTKQQEQQREDASPLTFFRLYTPQHGNTIDPGGHAQNTVGERRGGDTPKLMRLLVADPPELLVFSETSKRGNLFWFVFDRKTAHPFAWPSRSPTKTCTDTCLASSLTTIARNMSRYVRATSIATAMTFLTGLFCWGCCFFSFFSERHNS